VEGGEASGLTLYDLPFRWEPGPVLVVREEGRALVEAFLCDMASGDDRDGDKAGWDEQDEGSEEVESAMGELFVGADHLVRAPWDAGTLGLVRSLGGLVEGSMPPFGIEPRGWREPLELPPSLSLATWETWTVSRTGPDTSASSFESSDGADEAHNPAATRAFDPARLATRRLLARR
jgi:hypothetical protein